MSRREMQGRNYRDELLTRSELCVSGQVAVAQAGEVIFSGVNLTCPIASNFNDSFGGLYGDGAYPVY